MIKTLQKLRKIIINTKVFIQRSTSWLAIINAGMILFLVMSKFEDYGYDLEIGSYIIPLFILVILMLALFGYVEDKLGGFREEAEAKAKRNPYFKDITERLERIEDKLEK